MKRMFKVIGALLRVKLSNATVYRLSFFTGFFVDATVFLVQLLFLRLVTASAVTEWTTPMYSVFVGSFMTLDGLWMSLWFFGVIQLPDLIRTGQLDLMLLRPANPLCYLTFSSFDLGSVPVMLLGAALTLSYAAEGGFLTLGTALLWVLALLLMNALIYALSLLMREIAFWTQSIQAVGKMEDTLIESAMRLPLPAIKGAYRFVLLLAIPYGMVANFPAMALMGRTGPLEWLYAAALTAGFLWLAFFVWRRGLKRYESASS